ncbi:ORF68 [Anguillid herpesvirus 1]|uniref:Protein ORF68 n=1 Tax=Anguillid herpesvirus 1 TaxID=150286 RepID=A0A1J0REA0_9VIRU|nr:ORF68 [Anguillid herpesvirus 1]QRM17015.1 protein ORF68 [Anguillid herpesvirus 1]UTN00322.1 ORF68 [Anguillid herpesvirus 1]
MAAAPQFKPLCFSTMGQWLSLSRKKKTTGIKICKELCDYLARFDISVSHIGNCDPQQLKLDDILWKGCTHLARSPEKKRTDEDDGVFSHYLNSSLVRSIVSPGLADSSCVDDLLTREVNSWTDQAYAHHVAAGMQSPFLTNERRAQFTPLCFSDCIDWKVEKREQWEIERLARTNVVRVNPQLRLEIERFYDVEPVEWLTTAHPISMFMDNKLWDAACRDAPFNLDFAGLPSSFGGPLTDTSNAKSLERFAVEADTWARRAHRYHTLMGSDSPFR